MPFIDLDAIRDQEPMPGFRGRAIHTGHVTVVHWAIQAGAELPEHSHPHEQMSNLLEGEFEMMVDGQVQHMTPGTVAVIGPHVRHSGRAVTDCRFIDVFHPVREDYKE